VRRGPSGSQAGEARRAGVSPRHLTLDGKETLRCSTSSGPTRPCPDGCPTSTGASPRSPSGTSSSVCRRAGTARGPSRAGAAPPRGPTAAGGRRPRHSMRWPDSTDRQGHSRSRSPPRPPRAPPRTLRRFPEIPPAADPAPRRACPLPAGPVSTRSAGAGFCSRGRPYRRGPAGRVNAPDPGSLGGSCPSGLRAHSGRRKSDPVSRPNALVIAWAPHGRPPSTGAPARASRPAPSGTAKRRSSAALTTESA